MLCYDILEYIICFMYMIVILINYNDHFNCNQDFG
jgi:hypothetical protein